MNGWNGQWSESDFPAIEALNGAADQKETNLTLYNSLLAAKQKTIFTA
jgi:hypothetical protein